MIFIHFVSPFLIWNGALAVPSRSEWDLVDDPSKLQLKFINGWLGLCFVRLMKMNSSFYVHLRFFLLQFQWKHDKHTELLAIFMIFSRSRSCIPFPADPPITSDHRPTAHLPICRWCCGWCEWETISRHRTSYHFNLLKFWFLISPCDGRLDAGRVTLIFTTILIDCYFRP